MDFTNAAPILGGILLGAIGGYAYYKFVGCRSGVCPLTSNPYISVLYGAAVGFALSRGH